MPTLFENAYMPIPLIEIKYAHQPNSAIVPPLAISVNTPVIGIIKQLIKKTPYTIIRHFSHLSAFEVGFIERPIL